MFFIFPLQENKRIGGISFNLFFFKELQENFRKKIGEIGNFESQDGWKEKKEDLEFRKINTF